MQINGVSVKELRTKQIGAFIIYEAYAVHPRRNEDIEDIVERLTIACLACGTLPGTHFPRKEWWVCDLHGEETPHSSPSSAAVSI